MLAGFCFAKGRLPRKPWVMAIFGFFAVVLWVGPLLDTSSVFLMLSDINWNSLLLTYGAGLSVNISQAACTVLIMLLFGRPLLDKLDRIKLKYGMMEDENGL